MKIALLGIKSLPAKGGADRVVEKLLENYSVSNEYFIYLMKNNGSERLTCKNNLHYIYMPSFGGKHLKPFSYFFFCSLHYYIKGQYDIVHIHNSDFGLFSAIIRAKNNVKIIGTFHGDPYLRAKWGIFAKFYLKLSESFFIKNSDYLTSVAKSKTKNLKGNGDGKIIYLPNGIDKNTTLNYNPEFVKSFFGLNNYEYLLFACGRLDSTKGLHHLLEAYIKGDFKFPLLVIGDFIHDKIYSDKIERKAAKNNNIILYKNLLTQNYLLTVLKYAKLFIFPSEVEAMSMMLLEAISCKSPVICSDIEENTDIVGRDYKYLFQNKNADNLLVKLKSALLDESLDYNASILSDKIKKQFEWTEIASKYEQLYRSILNIN